MGNRKYRLGDLIEQIDRRNSDLKYDVEDVMGVANTKVLMETKARPEYADLSKFYILEPGEFIYNPRTSRNGEKVGMAYNNTDHNILFTFNNIPFRIKPACNCILNADYLYLYYLNPIFDKYARYNSWGSATELFPWEEMCRIVINLPPIDEQYKIVHDYQVVTDRIELLRKINENLEKTVQIAFDSVFLKFPEDANLIDTKLGMLPDYMSVKSFEDITVRVENGSRPSGGACDHGFPSLGADCAKGLGCYDETKAKYVPIEYAQNMKRGIVKGYELLAYKDGGTPSNFIPDFSIYGEGYPFERFAINEHVFIIDFGTPASNWFAYFLFKSKYVYGELAALGCKSAIPGISQSDLETLYLIDPTSDLATSFGNQYLPFLRIILINCKEILSLNKLQKHMLSSISKGV